MHRLPFLVLVSLLAAACASELDPEGPPPPVPGPSCEEQPHERCAHPIDRVLVPLLRGVGVEIREADAATLCRRLAVDVVGRLPSIDELDACLAAPDQATRAELFFSHPDATSAEARRLHELVRLDAFLVHYGQALELAAWNERLARGEIRYDEWAARAVIHPAFHTTRAGDAWTSAVYTIFLGRPAYAHEILGMRGPRRALASRLLCEGQVQDLYVRSCVEAGSPADDCRDIYVRQCGGTTSEGAADLCMCADGLCKTDVLGARIDLRPSIDCSGRPYDGFAYLERQTEFAMGIDDSCSDGSPGCIDTTPFFPGSEISPFAPLMPISAAHQAELDEIGAALVSRGDFWETAVDRELRALTGWWQTSFVRPDSDLPRIRRALVAALRDTGSLRELRRLVVTSLLYVRPYAPEGVREPWAGGPLRLLTAEPWLDSVGQAVGEEIGSCDARFVGLTDPYTMDLHAVASGLRVEEPSSLDAALFGGPTLFGPARPYAALAARVGGCSYTERPRAANLALVDAQASLATQLCAYGRGVVPEGASGTADDALDAVVRHLVPRIFSRHPTDDEVASLRADMRACLDAGACPDLDTAARLLCADLWDSTPGATF